jgi:hypothetical protein
MVQHSSTVVNLYVEIPKVNLAGPRSVRDLTSALDRLFSSAEEEAEMISLTCTAKMVVLVWETR